MQYHVAASMEAFHDYTLATHQERFVAVLESALAAWNDTGLGVIVSKGLSRRQRERPSLVKVQVPLKHRLKWRREPYLLSLHLPTYVLVDLPRATQAQDAGNTPTGPQLQHAHQPPYSAQVSQDPAAPPPAHVLTAAALLTEPSGSLPVQLSGVSADQSADVAVGSQLHAQQHDTARFAHNTALQHSRDTLTTTIASQHSASAGKQAPQVGSAPEWQHEQGAAAASALPDDDDDTRGWEVGVDLDMQEMMQRMEGILMQDAGQGDHDTEQGEDASSEGHDILVQEAQAVEPGHLSNKGTIHGDNSMVYADGQKEDAGMPAAAGPVLGNKEDSPSHARRQLSSSSRRVSRSLETPTAGSAQLPETMVSMQRADTAAGLSPLLVSGSQLGGWWPFCQSYRPWWRYTHQHKLQHWFGLDHFVLLQPHSYSRRFLDEGEARTVLSSLSCALTARGLAWPAMVPVHDALRDAYWGQLLIPPPSPSHTPGCSSAGAHQPAGKVPGGVSVRFITDSVHISGVSDVILTPQGQLQVLGGQLAGSAPHAAALCLHMAAQLSRAADGTAVEKGAQEAPALGQVLCSARYTYRLPDMPPPLPHDSSQAGSEFTSSFTEQQHAWDAAATWQPWAWYVDPISCVELDVVWQDVCLTCGAQGTHLPSCSSSTAASSTQQQEAGDAAGAKAKLGDRAWWFLRHHQAHSWQVHVLQQGLSDETGSLLGIHIADRQRVFVTLAEEGTAPAPTTQHVWPSLQEEPISPRSFHSMLSSLAGMRLLTAHESTLTAMGELAGDSWWWDRSRAPGSAASLPPPPAEAKLSAALLDIFHANEVYLEQQDSNSHNPHRPPALQHGSDHGPQPDLKYECVAPPNSLLAHLALHCMTMGSPRGVAVLWQRFTSSLRLDYWEAGQRLPRMFPATQQTPLSTSTAQLDLTVSPLHQKLQVLDACIARLQDPGTALLAINQQQHLDEMSADDKGEGVAVDDKDAPSQVQGQISQAAEQYYSASDDEDLLAVVGQPGSADQGISGSRRVRPQGVQHVLEPGIPLTHHPDRLMNTPQLQARPLLTSDRRAERAAQLRGLMRLEGASPEANAGITDDQLLGWELLASDMSAFKAANPGAVLQDFLVWHALPTTARQCYSVYSTDGDNASPQGWQYMWDTAAPCPAVVQKKLQDAYVEGERILHDLDNLSAPDVLDVLMAMGFTQAVHLLASSNAAQQLEPARQLCTRFHSLSHSLISSSCAMTANLYQPTHTSSSSVSDAAVAVDSPTPVLGQVTATGRLLAGFPDHVLDYLLDQLHFLEQALVLGESLLLRLPGCPQLCAALLHNTLHGKPSIMLPTQQHQHEQQQQQQQAAASTADEVAPASTRISASGSASILKEYICSADVPSASVEQPVLAGMLTCLDAAGYHEAGTGDHHTAQPEDWGETMQDSWPAPEHAEWVLTVSPGHPTQDTDGSTGSALPQTYSMAPLHGLSSRMYVQHAGGQTRIAMTLVSQ